MKKIIWILLLLVTSCTNSEIDYIHDKSPEERIEVIKSEYSGILASPEFGWKVYFAPVNTVGGWLILMKFNVDGTMEMKCEPVSGVDESGNDVTYRLDFSQTPELVIESYSQFSAWDEVLQEGETQFIIEKYENDKLYLKSKSDLGVSKPEQDISSFVFEKATEADWDISKIEDVMVALAANSVGAVVYDANSFAFIINFDTDSRVFELYASIEDFRGGVSPKKSGYYISPQGEIVLLEPLLLDGIGEISRFNVNLLTGAITALDNKFIYTVGAIEKIDISGHYTFRGNDYWSDENYSSPEGYVEIRPDPAVPMKFNIVNFSHTREGALYNKAVDNSIYIEGNALSVFTIPAGLDTGYGFNSGQDRIRLALMRPNGNYGFFEIPLERNEAGDLSFGSIGGRSDAGDNRFIIHNTVLEFVRKLD